MQSDDQALKSTLETRLAYVVTGDAEVDRISKAGLQGLTLFLAQRTALEAGEPIGIDPARDELAFFPLIYWPIVASAPKPTREALEHIDAYMKQGGTVLFDTRDAVEAPPGPGGATRGPGMQALRSILSALDIPELEPVPRDHVLTKTFYLLKDFPGPLQFRPAVGGGAARPRTRMSRRAVRPAPAMAYRRSSSPRTISPAPGRCARTAKPCCRSFPPSRASANSPSAPASTS